MMKKQFQVVIIGAGMAGISAAEHLYANGIKDIILVEARDRVGGRMHSIPYKGDILDLGAQWITGISPNNSVYNLATKLKIVKGNSEEIDDKPNNSNLLYYSLTSEGIPITQKAHEIAESMHYKILEEIEECYLRKRPHGGSIKTFYEEKMALLMNEMESEEEFPHLKKEVDHLLRGMFNVLRTYVGGEPDEGSVDLFGTSIELPGGEMPVKGGVGQIVKRLVDSLPSDKILLNSPVVKIDWSIPEVITVSTSESEIRCSYVISTIPLGVLKCHLDNLFVPDLGPSKINAIKKFHAGQICKIFLEWEEPWWTSYFGGFVLSRKDEDFSQDWTDCVGDFSRVKDHPNLLLTWVVGKYSPVIDNMDDDKVIDGFMKLIKKYTGDPSIARPSNIIRHKWNTDPFTLGGYSFPSVHSRVEDMEILASSLPNELTPRVLFAGEAACPKYFSYMHGARYVYLN